MHADHTCIATRDAMTCERWMRILRTLKVLCDGHVFLDVYDALLFYEVL